MQVRATHRESQTAEFQRSKLITLPFVYAEPRNGKLRNQPYTKSNSKDDPRTNDVLM
jgi:hypothetical protein